MLFRKVNQHLVLYIPCSNNNHIFAKVHSLVILDDHVSGNFIDVVNFSKNRKPHHVVSINIEVHIFHESLKVVVVSRLQFLPNCLFLSLNVVTLVLTIAQHVS